MISAINDINDVIRFSKELIEEGCNFHPDEDFKNYVNLNTGKPSYSDAEAEIRNTLMRQCFEVCNSTGVSVYDITMEVYLKETGLEKYIPLPSSVR